MLAKLGVRLATFQNPASRVINWIREKCVTPYIDRLTYVCVRGAVFFRIGKVEDAPTTRDSMRTRVLWQEALARGIPLQEFWLFGYPTELFIFKFDGRTHTFESLPRPLHGGHSESLWMDNKWKLKQKLLRAHLPVARGALVQHKSELGEVVVKLNPPLITKPHHGSRSRHTTLHIHNLQELEKGFVCAQMLSPYVIVEEELEGFVFRGTLVGGRLAGIVRREPAVVYGDGKKTVAELVTLENKNPKRDDTLFHKIILDSTAEKILVLQNLTLDSIVPNGAIVFLGDKTSRGAGGGISEVTRETHPDVVELLEECARVIDEPIIGIDFIMKDHTKSWKLEPRMGIIECNSVPFIDLHHFPLVGTPRNIAGMVWDFAYPNVGTMRDVLKK
jgi:D-alanine-D-alanine ligase-like ATP-grasp enzyme